MGSLMVRLYWVRHGENPANITKVFSYKLHDQPLTPKGVLQAEQTARFFEDMKIDGMYSSPTKRATETAEIIAASLDAVFRVLEDFLEVNVGELDGHAMNDERFGTHQKVIEDWYSGKLETRFPGGENYRELWDRMRNGYEKILSDFNQANVIVVGHGGGFKYTLKDLCQDVDTGMMRDIQIHNCSVSEILLRKEAIRLKGEVVSLGSTDHLHGFAAKVIPGLPHTQP